jgi:hypothetical protein
MATTVRSCSMTTDRDFSLGGLVYCQLVRWCGVLNFWEHWSGFPRYLMKARRKRKYEDSTRRHMKKMSMKEALYTKMTTWSGLGHKRARVRCRYPCKLFKHTFKTPQDSSNGTTRNTIQATTHSLSYCRPPDLPLPQCQHKHPSNATNPYISHSNQTPNNLPINPPHPLPRLPFLNLTPKSLSTLPRRIKPTRLKLARLPRTTIISVSRRGVEFFWAGLSLWCDLVGG